MESLGYPERVRGVGRSVAATLTCQPGCMYDCGSNLLDRYVRIKKKGIGRETDIKFWSQGCITCNTRTGPCVVINCGFKQSLKRYARLNSDRPSDLGESVSVSLGS